MRPKPQALSEQERNKNGFGSPDRSSGRAILRNVSRRRFDGIRSQKPRVNPNPPETRRRIVPGYQTIARKPLWRTHS